MTCPPPCMCFSTLSHTSVRQKRAKPPHNLVPVYSYRLYQQRPSKMKSFTYCICTYCIYYTHLIYIYSYIKFSYRHTFLVLFVRCWLHFQQEASTWKGRNPSSSGFLWNVSRHVASRHCFHTRSNVLDKEACWSSFKGGQTLLKSAWSAGHAVLEMLLWDRWSNSQLKIHRGRRASASTGGSAAGNGLWAWSWAVPT